MEHSTHAIQFSPNKYAPEEHITPVSEIYKNIHKAIHSNSTAIMINDRRYPINVATNGCRTMFYNGIRFMEQNKAKNSVYARAAQAGKRITWGIQQGEWIYIDDETPVLN